MLTDDGLILRLDDVMKAAPHITDEIELEFLTPTSIKVDGKWTSQLTFEHLIRNLLRRIRFLNYFHCGEDLDTEIDAYALIKAAQSVRHKSRLQWLQRGRYSHRAEAVVPMSGFMGNIRFEGDVTPFLPFICLGEYLHIGHHTAFGYGHYHIRRNDESGRGDLAPLLNWTRWKGEVTSPLLKGCLEKILKPLAQAPLCYKIETDKNHGDNRAPY